ncbi:MAG: creatininase family protein [Verrucomicrobiota bacterium]
MHLSDLTWPEIEALPKDMPIVLPVAALEQHSLHLPLYTDSLLLGEITRRAGLVLGDRVLWAPLMWLGNSEHHLDFPGTLSASPRTYLDLLVDLVENSIRHGFKRIVIINGHGGNDVPGRQAVFEVRQRHRQRADLLLLFATYWLLGSKPWESEASLQQRQMGHACEWETSMIMRLAPHLVRETKSLETVAFGNAFEPGVRGWTTRDRSEPGHIGSPQLATAEKGEALFGVFAADMVQWLERVLRWDGQSWNG